MASTMPLVSDSSNSRSPPRSTNHTTSHRHKPRLQWTTSLLLLLACLTCRVAALSPDPPLPAETLAIDTRVPTMVQGKWVLLSREEFERRELVKRAESISETSSAPAAETTTFKIAVSTITMASTTSVAAASPLPSPLDGSISSNFTNIATSKCPAFLNSFLTNPTFKQCYPFSMLLQGSTSFFEAERSLVSITQVLDASCSANVTLCSTYLTDLAKNLTSQDNCGQDYNLGNSVVVQSYLAMISYQTLYGATCLKDPATAAYCYANAVTNLTTPSNVYFYFLPLNISLPGSSIPSCSWCLEKTMGIYQSAAANRDLPIANTYMSAAQQVNTICGPTFVNTTLPNAIVSSGSSYSLTPLPRWLLLIVPLVAVAQWVT